MVIEFSAGFFWGAATSAYQIEGGNMNSDWWQWEKENGLKELSGDACDSYRQYERDFDLAASLNHNTHRFSIEWSRIQPQPDEFSEAALEHYASVIAALKKRKIEPVVTLHHFTNPLWFAKLGGWENRKACDYFLRYVEKVVSAFGKDVRFWITINEPLVYAYHAYIIGAWPPQKKSFWKAKIVQDNFIRAHIKAYRLIHKIYRDKNLSTPRVSIAHNLQAFCACTSTLKNRLAVYLRDRLYNFSFVNRLARAKTLDYIGINYYSRSLVEARKWKISSFIMDTCQDNHLPLQKNSLGWDIYPQGLYQLLLRFKKYNLPVMITENGICTGNDSQRWEYISGHLKNIHLAIAKGVNVIGYLYWSLIDNFEWDKGFNPRFGLIEVDYRSYQRIIRESARKFALVCAGNKVEI